MKENISSEFIIQILEINKKIALDYFANLTNENVVKLNYL